MKHRLKDTILALADADVKFVIAGGVAVVLHGAERLTMDLDIALDLGADNVSRFISVMKKLGLVPRVPVPPEILADPEKIRQIVDEKNAIVFTFWDVDEPISNVDVFLREDLSYDVLSKDVEIVEIENRKVYVVSRNKLIDIKLKVDPSRAKDLQDIEELRRLESADGE